MLTKLFLLCCVYRLIPHQSAQKEPGLVSGGPPACAALEVALLVVGLRLGGGGMRVPPAIVMGHSLRLGVLWRHAMPISESPPSSLLE